MSLSNILKHSGIERFNAKQPKATITDNSMATPSFATLYPRVPFSARALLSPETNDDLSAYFKGYDRRQFAISLPNYEPMSYIPEIQRRRIENEVAFHMNLIQTGVTHPNTFHTSQTDVVDCLKLSGHLINQNTLIPDQLAPQVSVRKKFDYFPGLCTPPPRQSRRGRIAKFPQKLHQMLLDLEKQDDGKEIASFLPCGRGFVIFKPKLFAEAILPKYFSMSRFSSFQRQLNLYEFQRIKQGPDKGGYYHDLFVREKPGLCNRLKRIKIKGDKGFHSEFSNFYK